MVIRETLTRLPGVTMSSIGIKLLNSIRSRTLRAGFLTDLQKASRPELNASRNYFLSGIHSRGESDACHHEPDRGDPAAERADRDSSPCRRGTGIRPSERECQGHGERDRGIAGEDQSRCE